MCKNLYVQAKRCLCLKDLFARQLFIVIVAPMMTHLLVIITLLSAGEHLFVDSLAVKACFGQQGR